MRVLMVSDVYFPRVNGVSTSIETFRRTLEGTLELIAAIGVVFSMIAAFCISDLLKAFKNDLSRAFSATIFLRSTIVNLLGMLVYP